MFVKNSDVNSVLMTDGVERKVLAYGDNLMTVEVKFKKGAAAPMHNHVHEQVSYIVKGRFQFTIGNEMRELNAGDSVYIRCNIEHQVIAMEEGIVMDSFTPAREDFLK